MKHPVDRLFGGIFLTVGVTVLVLVLLALLPLDSIVEGRVALVLTGVALSACIVFPRPLLKRTPVQRSRCSRIFVSTGKKRRTTRRSRSRSRN